MDLTTIQEAFKIIGKIIYISQLAPVDANAYKQVTAASIRQGNDGDLGDWGVIGDVFVPLHAQMKSIVTTLEGVPRQAKAAVDNYLKRVLAPDLSGVTSASSANLIAAALVDEMADQSATVDSSGVGNSNDDGFAAYFYSNYGVALPQSGSPNVPDTWIDNEVVA